MNRNDSRPPVLVIRCDRCGSPLARCEGELFCPDCTAFTIPPAPATAPAWFVATTTGGHYVHEGSDLEALLDWCRGLLGPGEPEGDIVVSAGLLVYAVLTGDGRAVRVRP
jgi:hypothetical protein